VTGLGSEGSGPRAKFSDEYHLVQRQKMRESRARKHVRDERKISGDVTEHKKALKEVLELAKQVKDLQTSVAALQANSHTHEDLGKNE